MDFTTVKGVVQVHQHSYIDNLQLLHLQAAHAVQRQPPLMKLKKRSKIGQIVFVAKQTRPDVMFNTCSLASDIKNATVQSVHEVNKVVCKLKSEKVTLKFQHLGDNNALNLIFFSDVTLGNLSDGGQME